MERKSCISITLVVVCLLLVVYGCGPKKATYTGFLNDYSKLEAQSDVSARYVAPGNLLGRYSKFIIDPVVIHFHTGSKAKAKLKE